METIENFFCDVSSKVESIPSARSLIDNCNVFSLADYWMRKYFDENIFPEALKGGHFVSINLPHVVRSGEDLYTIMRVVIDRFKDLGYNAAFSNPDTSDCRIDLPRADRIVISWR